MIFWTPDVTLPIQNWVGSVTEQIMCCQIGTWNGTDYPDFELRLSDKFEITCITLCINDNEVTPVIDAIWKYVSINEKLVLGYIEQQKVFRRDTLYRQYEKEKQLDLGFYDCIDLLSCLNKEVVLCIRVFDSIQPYLLSWLDYILKKQNIKILILNREGVKGLNKLKNIPRITFPPLSKGNVIETCSNAIQELTGTSMSYSELDLTFTNSLSLKEFIVQVQSAVLRQSTPSALIMPYSYIEPI